MVCCMSILNNLLERSQKYTLVISGWGTRGFYALGILKALEELELKKKIDAIYGVSVGAIIASFWAAGYSAEEIYNFWYNFTIFSWKTLGISWKKSVLSSDTMLDLFKKQLPKTFEELSKKIYIWAVDSKKSAFVLVKEGPLYEPLLWSMAIPGVFPPIDYNNMCLIDGWVLNNFPVEIARKKYPNHKIIWIFLNQYAENPKLTNILDVLSVTFGILTRWPSLGKLDIPDHLFNRELTLKTLDINKKEMKKAFDLWYKDWLKEFSKKQ